MILLKIVLSVMIPPHRKGDGNEKEPQRRRTMETSTEQSLERIKEEAESYLAGQLGAHTKPNEILPPLVANIWGYRNKARMGVKYVPGKNKVLVGFREKDSRYLANLVQCEVLHPSVGMHLTDISDMLYKLEARDKIPQIEVAVDDYDTALIIRHLTDLCESDLNQLKQFAEDFKYKLYLQPKGIDTIHQVYPEPPELMHYRLDDYNVELQFEPYQFTQVNSEINKKMIARAIELLEVTKEDNVLDLFCGLGNFTLPIATKCKSIIGVEGDADSIKQAQANAALNDIQNAKFYCANLFEPPYNREWSQQRFDKVLLDPPRTGAKQVIDFFNQWQPQKIVYVSCNPATLARDAALIIEQGYTLQKAGVMDMFPHTQHVESIALFEKVKGKH